MKNLSSTLEQYGGNPRNLLRFGEDDEAGLLPYATLLAARSAGDPDLAAVLGVYEWQSNPLVFLVAGDEIRDDDHFRSIRRRVALRGDAPYLGVVRPGQLTLYHVALDATGREASQLHDLPAAEPKATFSRLANFRPEAASRSKWISQVVLGLLRETIRNLKNCSIANNDKILDTDAISLAGRALFLRFLGDRKLLPQILGPDTQLFDNATRAEQASHWLDETFNGDFLPLSDANLFSKLTKEAFHTLGNILHRAPGGQLYLEWREDWAHLDFAHIPVGVLSEAYESYMREYATKQQKKEGSYYTPRAIADLMVRGAFHALRRNGKAHEARVLDPAAGAGVFLISAFRQLVAERWQHNGKRPDTKVLRDILYQQITGFDINEAALRFAALGLYLISIELDPEPEPVEKLRFKQDLRGSVLHDFSNPGTQCLGSLGKQVSAEHTGRYDLVIGNPPWASSTKLPAWSEVQEIVTRIAKERLPQQSLASLLPNEPLDLPFVWRAMEWAKSGGQIVFALHARLLFQQADGMAQARSALFRALDVSGILNGAELRQTRVWPEIYAPFCLLFARNQVPHTNSAFRFVSPHLEDKLNGAGILRMDAMNAERINSSQVAMRPEILKLLFRGSTLDLEIFDSLKVTSLITLHQYWGARFGLYKGHLAQSGNGYQTLGESSEVQKNGDGKPGVSADYLFGLKELTSESFEKILVDINHLDYFIHDRIHRRRPRALFKSPLLIIHRSPTVHSGRIRVAIANCDLVFNKSYHGYSAWGHENGGRLVRYLALLLSSKLAIWFALISGGMFGVERDVIENENINTIPFVTFESLEDSALERIDALFDTLTQDATPETWAKVDAWAASLYGLREQDLQVIDDTLRFNLPFAANKKAAQTPPTSGEINTFCETLKSELLPWAEKEGKNIDVQPTPVSAGSPWATVRVYATGANNRNHAQSQDDWPEVLKIADDLAATEIIHPDAEPGCLWLARLNQARYWSRSQARLVARRIIWEHLDALFGSEDE